MKNGKEVLKLEKVYRLLFVFVFFSLRSGVVGGGMKYYWTMNWTGGYVVTVTIVGSVNKKKKPPPPPRRQFIVLTIFYKGFSGGIIFFLDMNPFSRTVTIWRPQKKKLSNYLNYKTTNLNNNNKKKLMSLIKKRRLITRNEETGGARRWFSRFL